MILSMDFITFKRYYQRLFLLMTFPLFSITASKLQAQCIDVDLQAVSIDPGNTSILKGMTTTITVSMKNNSSCPIPMKDATAQITFSAVYLNIGTPVNFRDDCKRWTYLGAVSNGKQHNLFFRNDGSPIPPGGASCAFHFDVKGKAVSAAPIPITLASSLSATAITADVNGNNQSAATELFVTATAPIPPPVVLSDFSITAKECNAMLAWKTASAIKIDSVEIAFGKDGLQFDKIGAIKGNQTAAGSNYEYVYDQGNGRGFYRLKIIEQGGKITLSNIVNVDTKCIIKKGFIP